MCRSWMAVIFLTAACSRSDGGPPGGSDPRASAAPCTHEGPLEPCRTRCEQDDFAACGELAARYAAGKRGATKDPRRAARLLQRICDRGDADGCLALAFSYWEGSGVVQDPERARRLAGHWCLHGGARSCSEFGSLYANGLGVPQDLELAHYLLGLGCDGGDGDACSDLGLLVARGQGVAAERERGRELLRRACSMGSRSGCDRLRADFPE